MPLSVGEGGVKETSHARMSDDKNNVKKRIFVCIDLVWSNLLRVAEQMLAIASDTLGCLSKEKNSVWRSHIKLETLGGWRRKREMEKE